MFAAKPWPDAVVSADFSAEFAARCAVEELVAARGIAVSYGTVRQWELTSG
jgi:hypothetical protein